MRKLVVLLAFFTLTTVTFTSCKKEKKEEVEKEVIKEERASNELYQCPMDCEKGKSYTEAGKCPVCKMDLKKKEVDLNDDSHEDHEHEDEAADSKETAMSCAKHPDGKCACKTSKA